MACLLFVFTIRQRAGSGARDNWRASDIVSRRAVPEGGGWLSGPGPRPGPQNGNNIFAIAQIYNRENVRTRRQSSRPSRQWTFVVDGGSLVFLGM